MLPPFCVISRRHQGTALRKNKHYQKDSKLLCHPLCGAQNGDIRRCYFDDITREKPVVIRQKDSQRPFAVTRKSRRAHPRSFLGFFDRGSFLRLAESRTAGARRRSPARFACLEFECRSNTYEKDILVVQRLNLNYHRLVKSLTFARDEIKT